MKNQIPRQSFNSVDLTIYRSTTRLKLLSKIIITCLKGRKLAFTFIIIYIIIQHEQTYQVLHVDHQKQSQIISKSKKGANCPSQNIPSPISSEHRRS